MKSMSNFCKQLQDFFVNAKFLENFREIDRTATKIRLLNLRNTFLVVNVNFGIV